MTVLASDEHRLATTSGTIAMANLQAQIDSLSCATHRAGSGQQLVPAAQRAVLIDLLTLRGHVLGRIADYEHAAELAGRLVRDAPDDSTALLARARARATLHRFPAALADLDAAGRSGSEQSILDAERSAIFQAVGCHAEALVLCRRAVERRRDFTALSALAVLEAERGRSQAAECLFAEARRNYHGVAPFPIASLDFRRALMWLAEGELAAARTWFESAHRLVPGYAPALAHLAEVEAALGQCEAAIDRLRPLALSSDDPEYMASLAGVLRDAGHAPESATWRARAAARYDELVQRHPDAFTDHAAHFWLTVGANRPKGHQLTLRDHAIRRAARTHVQLHHARFANN